MISGQYLWPSNDNIFVFLYSVGIFSYIAQSHVFDTMGKLSAIKEISELSLGIYILHPVVLNFLNKFLKIYPDSLPLVVGEFVFWVAAFVGAYVMTKLCCRIPKLGKYL